MKTSALKIKRRKLRKGFTLIETLLALMIMVLFTLIMARILETATVAYSEVVDNSNADVLLSTIQTILRDELAGAKNISVSEDGKTIFFNDGITGAEALVTCKADEKNQYYIYIEKYGTERPIIKAAKNLTAEFERAKYDQDDNNVIVIENLIIRNNKSDLAKTELMVINIQ